MPFKRANERTATPADVRCRYCGSEDLHRSRRRGLIEGVLFRIIFLAPVRCSRCQTRYATFGFGPKTGRRKKYHSFMEFIGIRDTGRQRKFRIQLITLLLLVLSVLVTPKCITVFVER